MGRLAALGCVVALVFAAAGSAERGPWPLALLPGMGTLSWSCDLSAHGYRVYRLSYDASGAAANQDVALSVGGRVVYRRALLHQLVRFPAVDAPVQTLRFAQAIEPGTLRAIVTVDFRPRPVSPSHCWPYLPPRLTVTLLPR